MSILHRSVSVTNEECYNSKLPTSGVPVHPSSKSEKLSLFLEALLFVNPEGLTYNQLAEIVGKTPPYSPLDLKDALDLLIKRYSLFSSPLELFKASLPNGDIKYCFRVKKNILRDPRLSPFLAGDDLSPKEIDVLAYIAYFQPINEEEIWEVFGKGTKKIINSLLKRGFIAFDHLSSQEPHSKASSSRKKHRKFYTTELFASYLGVEDDKNIIKKKIEAFF